MRRFFVSPEEFKKDIVKITDDELHHLKNVCRLTEGERIELLDGAGNIAQAEIEAIDKKAATTKVINRSKVAPIREPRLHVYLSLPKFQTMDLIVEKLVELDVAELTPVLSERSFLKKKSADLNNKMERWNKIARGACKQSGRAWPLKINDIQLLKTALEKCNSTQSLFLYEGSAATDLKSALEEWKDPKTIELFIGSEGGFSPSEVENFQARGLKPTTIGDLVLRVETACIAVCSVIKYHFGLMK